MKRTELNRSIHGAPVETLVRYLLEPLREVCVGLKKDAATHNDSVRLTTRQTDDASLTIVVAIGTEASDMLRAAMKAAAARIGEQHLDASSEGMESEL